MTQRQPVEAPEPLDSRHKLDAFDCGKPTLNTFLKKFALTNQQNHSARTYVVHRSAVVAGYYSLAAASVEHAVAPTRVVKGLANRGDHVCYLDGDYVERSTSGFGTKQTSRLATHFHKIWTESGGLVRQNRSWLHTT